MAFVRVEQRNARLAAPVRLDTVNGKDGPLSKGTVTLISNVRKGSGQDRENEATSIQWTLWGKLADNAAEYLGRGSRVNAVGRVQNNNYQDGAGKTVYGLTFTCEELDYLDSRADAEARRARQDGPTTAEASAPSAPAVKGNGRAQRPGKRVAPPKAAEASADDIPF